MSKHTYTFKTNDAPQITDFLDGNLTLDGASVAFSMKPVVARGTKTVDSASATIHEFDGERDVTEVSYTLDSADTSESGDYVAEFEATYDDGRIETYPNGRYYFISIEDEV
jgi:hypothetical protein